MNSCVIVTLNLPAPYLAVDLELSHEIELQHLVPLLAEVLDLPPVDNVGRPIAYQLVDGRRVPFHIDATLAGAGVVTGDRLSLVSRVSAAQPVRCAAVSGMTALVRCPSGAVFPLDGFDKNVVRVGRYDRRIGESPDIDLSRELYGNTVSRSHALFRRNGDRWELMSATAQNVTRINSEPVAYEESKPLRPKDVITLGGVTLFYDFGRLS